MTDPKEELRSQREESAQLLANSFMRLARELLSSGNNEMASKSTTDDDLDEERVTDKGLNLLVTPLEQEAEPSSSGETPEHPDHATRSMRPQHAGLSDLWDKLHGEGQFCDCRGGIEGRESECKSKWRKHIDGQHFC